MDDPLFQVKDDIESSLSTAASYCERYLNLCSTNTSEDQSADQDHLSLLAVGTHQEKEWLSTELRNILRSIEWDLEDLEQTSSERGANRKLKKLSKTSLNLEETDSKRQFIEETRDNVEVSEQIYSYFHESMSYILDDFQRLRSKMSGFDSRFKPTSPLTSSFRSGTQNGRLDDQGTSRNLNSYKYSRLENDDKNSANDDSFVDDVLSQQKLILRNQDENLDKISSSVHVLKDMSHRIGAELDEQSVMIDDLTHETERTHSRLDVVMKKLIKVINMSDDKRQWQVIGILVVILLIIIILFFV